MLDQTTTSELQFGESQDNSLNEIMMDNDNNRSNNINDNDSNKRSINQQKKVTNIDNENGVCNNQNNRVGLRRLEKFYENKNIFLTGATGFVGKVTLIKILSEFPNVGSIYIVMRPKKGQTAQQRFNRMLSEAPFSIKQLRPPNESDNNKRTNNKEPISTIGIETQNAWLKESARLRSLDWSKVIMVEGNMSAPELGLSEEVKEEIFEKVDIIFNIAASVAFDAPLKQNLNDNYSGTSNLVQLAMRCRRLCSFVHVSTFYTNSHRTHIEESILPMERDSGKMADLIKALPESVCKSLENPQFMENRPNTYIYTKAMTEEMLKKQEGHLPLAIVRPSIVTPAIKEPLPGWVDNVNGPMGLGALASLGILRTIDWNYDGVADFVPVDMVANSVLAVAERTARLYQKEIKVYNCSSSSLNPITWGSTFELLRNEGFKAPPYKLLRVPITVPHYNRANRFKFAAIKLSELLFAYLIDLILIICGQKTLLVRLTKKLHHGYEILKPFTTNQYTCTNDNLEAALNDLDPIERDRFNFDITSIDMDKYFRTCYYGVRMGILKEDISNVQAAVRKLRIHQFFSSLVMILFYSFLVWTSYRLMSNVTGLQQIKMHIF